MGRRQILIASVLLVSAVARANELLSGGTEQSKGEASLRPNLTCAESFKENNCESFIEEALKKGGSRADFLNCDAKSSYVGQGVACGGGFLIGGAAGAVFAALPGVSTFALGTVLVGKSVQLDQECSKNQDAKRLIMKEYIAYFGEDDPSTKALLEKNCAFLTNEIQSRTRHLRSRILDKKAKVEQQMRDAETLRAAGKPARPDSAEPLTAAEERFLRAMEQKKYDQERLESAFETVRKKFKCASSDVIIQNVCSFIGGGAGFGAGAATRGVILGRNHMAIEYVPAPTSRQTAKFAMPAHIGEALQKYPAFEKKFEAMRADIVTSGVFASKDASFLNGSVSTPKEVRAAIQEVYKKLNDPKAMADYSDQLAREALGHMHLNSSARTRAVEFNQHGVAGAYLKDKYTTKDELLKKGTLDRQSVLAVLVRRAQDAGENIAIIPSTGSFNKNTTRTWKFDNFYQVPRKGPFFDNEFPRHGGHGQDIHFLQMDYVRDVIAKATNGNPRLFWDYIGSNRHGHEFWDEVFDSFARNYTSPEYLGPLLRQHLPLH